MKIFGFIILMTFFVAGNVSAQIGNGSGTSSGEILNIEIGGRATAMGGASVAISDDPTAIFQNASGLGAIESTELQFGYCNWYQDISLNYLGAAVPFTGRITAGLAITYVNLGSFQGYSADDIAMGEFNGHDMVIGLSMGLRAGPGLSLGMTAKGISEKLEESSATGFAFDLGGTLITGAFSFGLAVKNIGPGLKYEYERAPLPTQLDAGIGLCILDQRLTLASDIDLPRDGYASIHHGVEYLYLNTIFLRCGYRYDLGGVSGSGNHGIAYGFGIKIIAGKIDYSFIPDDELGGIHRLDFALKVRH